MKSVSGNKMCKDFSLSLEMTGPDIQCNSIVATTQIFAGEKLIGNAINGSQKISRFQQMR
jgi:hypothetical protein